MAQTQVVLVTAGYDHTIKFWDATSGRCYKTLQHPESQVNKVEVTSDKQYLAAAGNPHIKLYDVGSAAPNQQHLQRYEGHTSNVTAIGFQRDTKWMFSGSEDGTVKIWDCRASACQLEFESRAAVTTVVLHPNQNELISGDQNGNIRVWDITGKACSCELVPEVDTAIRSLSVMWDGSLVVAANNLGTCFVWRLLGKPGAGGAGALGGPHGLSPSQPSQVLTAAMFQPLHKLQAHSAYILKCLLSPEFCDSSRLLATASSDHSVKIWNLDTFALEQTLRGHSRWVWDCCFSVDGAYLVTASSDTTARLWDVATGEGIRLYQGHQKAAVCCALNDGTELPAS